MQPVTNKEQNELIAEYHDAAFRQRGRLINQTILLERCIDYYICCHFVKTEALRREFSDLLISTIRVNFNSKIDVFGSLLKEHDKSIYSRNKKCIKKLHDIKEYRNNLAHWQIDSSIRAARHYRATKEITFTKHMNGIKPMLFGEKELDEHYKLIYDAVLFVQTVNETGHNSPPKK